MQGRILDSILRIFLISSIGGTAFADSPYCFKQYSEENLTYKLQGPESLDDRGFHDLKRLSDIYSTNSKKIIQRGYVGDSYRDDLIEMGMKTETKYAAIAKIDNKALKCNLDLKESNAVCGELILRKNYSGLRPDQDWLYGLQFREAEYKGEKYFLINTIRPLWRLGTENLVVKPNDSIYKIHSSSCLRKNPRQNDFPDLLWGFMGYPRVSNQYVCVKSSICTKQGSLTQIQESLLLVPSKYSSFMEKIATNVEAIRTTEQAIPIKNSIKKFLNEPFVIPLTIQYKVLATIEKPDLGF